MVLPTSIFSAWVARQMTGETWPRALDADVTLLPDMRSATLAAVSGQSTSSRWRTS